MLPALLQDTAAGAEKAKLPSKSYRYEDLPVRGTGPNRSRPILDGLLRSGFGIEMHETELGPGLMPHPPHKHVHEELILIRDGIVEVTIGGKSSTLGPGSVGFIATGEEHGWKNVGQSVARYFIVTLGR
jgi:quercetin dioxygenase-like cupin family protein